MPLKDSSYHVVLIAVLGAWSVLPVSIANYIFYLLILVVASCIGRAGYEHAKLRREAWLGQYLKASSTLRKPLAVGVISWFYIFPLATFLSVILLLNLRSGGLAVWGAVLFGFLVFQWSTRSLARKVEEHVIEKSEK